ncbi:hypothetical protein V8F33_006119 [Rhypophila sp. PSN 637]
MTRADQPHTVTIAVRPSITPENLGRSGPGDDSFSNGHASCNIILHGGRYTITSMSICNPLHDSESSPQCNGQDSSHVHSKLAQIGDVLTFEPEGKLTFPGFSNMNEKGQELEKEEVSSFWNTKIQACQSMYNRPAGVGSVPGYAGPQTEGSNGELKFAVIGTLVFYAEDERLGRMSVTFPGVGFALSAADADGQGQGQDGDEKENEEVKGKGKQQGKWWFGGQTFEHMKEGQSRSGGGAHTVRALGSDREGRARYFYFSPSSYKFGSDGGMEAGGGDIVLTRIYGH